LPPTGKPLPSARKSRGRRGLTHLPRVDTRRSSPWRPPGKWNCGTLTPAKRGGGWEGTSTPSPRSPFPRPGRSWPRAARTGPSDFGTWRAGRGGRCCAATPARYSAWHSPRKGTTVASAGTDAVVRLWDVTAGCERAVYDWEIGLVNCVAFAPDGMTAAAAGSSGAVFLWDLDG